MSSTQSHSTATSASNASIFPSFHAYPFDSDSAFLAGLSQIFGHPGTPVTEAETTQKPDLVLSAKCFYYTRKFKTPVSVDPTEYKAWLASSTQNGLHISNGADPSNSPPSLETATTSSEPTIPTTAPLQGQAQAQASTSTNMEPVQHVSASSQTTDQQPPYPTSFAAIVDLITNNKPIPGIEEIPTTVLELGSSKQDQATRRRKPWEKDDLDAKTDSTILANNAADSRNTEPSGDSVRSEGLLRLLRPDAVPDSGLVAKD